MTQLTLQKLDCSSASLLFLRMIPYLRSLVLPVMVLSVLQGPSLLGLSYVIELPHGSLTTTYAGGNVAGIPLYEDVTSQFSDWEWNALFQTEIRAEIDPDNWTITFPLMKFTIDQPVSFSRTEYRTTGFGQSATFTITRRVQPFSVSFTWDETRELDQRYYDFPTWQVPATIGNADSIVVDYSIAGPTEEVSGTVVLTVPETCVFVNSFNSSSYGGDLRFVDYPDVMGIEFNGAYHYYSVLLQGATSVTRTVDGQEFNLDFSRLWIGPNSYGMKFQRSADSVLITTNASPVVGGTISGGGEQEVGQPTVLQANPSPGYVFAGWSVPYEDRPNPFVVEAATDLAVSGNFAPDLGDDDGDLLSNYDEIIIWETAPDIMDTDKDTLPDGIEVEFGLDPKVSNTGLLQYLREHAAELSLLPTAGTVQLMANGTLLTHGAPGTVVYQLERLGPDGEWEPVGEPLEWVSSEVENLLLMMKADFRLEADEEE